MFGMSAGTAALVGSIAAPVIGGLMGGQSSGGQQSSKQELDPRMQSLLYGDGTAGNTGYLNDVNNLRKQQMQNGGLNPMQTAGLEMQRQTLMDPRYSQGYDQMRQQGSSLMSQPVAGNPFSQGYKGGGNFSPNLGMSGGQQMPDQTPYQTNAQQPLYQPNAAMAGAMQPLGAYQAAPQAAPAALALEPSPLDKYLRQLQEDEARRKFEMDHGRN